MLDETITETLFLIDEEKPLPEGWRLVRLGDVCELNPTRSSLVDKLKDRADETLTSFVQMSAVDERLGIVARPEIKPFGQMKRGYTIFAEDDVLFAKITPCMQNGKHAIVRNLIDGFGFGSTEFHVLRATEKIISSLLHSFLRQPSVLKAAMASFTGTVGQQRVPETFLANLQIPLPPTIEEQRRIAAILDEQMKAIEQARLAVEEQLAAANLLSSAFLRSVFESEEAQNWQKRKLGEIAKTCSGSTPSRGNPDYYKGSISWVKTGELKDGLILETEEHISELALKETSLRLLPPETLLIAMYGQGQTRGRTGLLKKPATTNQACFAVLPNETFDSYFLQYWFRHNYQRLRQETEGRGGNQPNLNGDVLNKQIVSLPDEVNEQGKFVEKLNEQMLVVGTLKQSLTDKLEAIKRLPAALLRKAFAGEL